MLNANLSKIGQNETVAVALSGGMDSVCLLYYLFENRAKLSFNLVAINVEHGIRGVSSVLDSEFCANLCNKLGIRLYSFSVDAPSFAKTNRLSLEESARKLRYNCFFDCIDKKICDKVAVAHHLSDNAETILFNLFRGTSLSGAKGVLDSAYEGKIIRPFLNVSKQEIRLYVDKHNISYITDETNNDTAYTRNHIRINVFPAIKQVFPKVEFALSRFATACKQDDEFLYKLADNKLIAIDNGFSIDINLEYPVFSRAVVLALKRLGISKDYTMANIEDVWALTTNQTGKMVHLPQNIYAVREYDNIIIRPKQDNRLTPVPFKFGNLEIGKYNLSTQKVEKDAVKFGNGLYFDLDKLPSAVVVRRRENGDKFIKFNGQAVSLKKFLTDKKLSDYQKNNLLLIAKENLVYIIVNVEISQLLMIDKDTKNVVKLTCKEKEV